MGETVKLEEAENKARGGIAGWWKQLDDKAREKHPEWWKLFLWAVMGFIANVPELGAYYLCLYGFRNLEEGSLGAFGFIEKVIKPDPDYTLPTVVIAFMISTAIGYAIAFVLNRKTTFRADSNMALSIFFYVLAVIFTIVMNGLVVGPVLSGLFSKLTIPSALSRGISKFLSMLVPGLWFYPANRFLIHRVRKPKGVQPDA